MVPYWGKSVSGLQTAVAVKVCPSGLVMTDDPGVVDAAHLALNAVHSIVYGSVASVESN